MANALGQFVDIVGTKLGLPELKVSEWLGGGNTVNTQNYQYAQGNNPYANTAPAIADTTTSSGGGVYTYPSVGSKYVAPTSSGGSTSRGGGGGGTPPNPYTTYYGGTKLADLIGEGKYDQWGNPISGGGGGGPDLQAEVDATYAPAYANLQALEDQYGREYPTNQAFIEQSYGQVKPQIEAEQQTKMGGLAEQRTRGKREEKSQFDTARNRYNELKQGLLTRFGGASSTGEATQELLGRTANQEMGQIQQNFGQLYGDIGKEETNTKTFYATKLTDLEKEKQLKLQELKNDFDTKIQQLRTKRGELDSNKSAARLAMLREYAAQARQIQYDNQKAQQQLQLWMQMKDEAINTAKQFQAKSFTVPGIPGLVNSFSVTGGGRTGEIQGEGSFGMTQDQLDKNGYFLWNNKLYPKKGDNEDPFGIGA